VPWKRRRSVGVFSASSGRYHPEVADPAPGPQAQEARLVASRRAESRGEERQIAATGTEDGTQTAPAPLFVEL
jgi:hypothetical protein